ncbi:immunoglobulin-like domain-containing protein, partial [uncultured Clostridium sp.]|uniref:immunoglobulin-like domain-containing protein n=1 Tax=uncultured Clostridium sp. TaxID=59620 RepID=UPI0034A02175
MNKRLVSIICAAALFTQTLPTNAIATTIEDAFIKKGLNSEVDKDKSDSNSEESSSKDENETSQDNKLKEEELGLDKVKFNAYIDKTDQLLFSIGFDEKEKKFTVSEQSEKNISEETPEETMYTIKIFDKEQKEKFSVELKGKDTGNSEELEPLKSLNYEVGDFIQITPTDSKDVLKITGNIQGDVDKQKEDYSDGIDNYDYIGNVRFQVEEDHLKTVYNEAPVINGLTDIEESENPMNDILTGISIKDDHDGDIDNSKIVPLITELEGGVLEVSYTVEDSWGRKATGKRKISPKKVEQEEVKQEEPKIIREEIKLRTGSSSTSQNTNGLAANEITVEGTPYFNGQHVRFKIRFDTKAKQIQIVDQDGRKLSNTGNNEYFRFVLYDKDMNEKASVSLLGNDKSDSDKLDKIANQLYEEGDFIGIWHAETKIGDGNTNNSENNPSLSSFVPKLKIAGTVRVLSKSNSGNLSDSDETKDYSNGMDKKDISERRFQIKGDGLKEVTNEAPVFGILDVKEIARGGEFDPLDGIKEKINDDFNTFNDDNLESKAVSITYSSYDVKKVGEQTITYTATDKWGRSSTATRKLIVTSENPMDSKYIEFKSGDKSLFKIKFDSVEKKFLVDNLETVQEEAIDSTVSSSIFKLKVYTKGGVLQKTLNIKGTDNLKTVLKKFDGYKYNLEDYIEVWSNNPKNIVIHGVDRDTKPNGTVQPPSPSIPGQDLTETPQQPSTEGEGSGGTQNGSGSSGNNGQESSEQNTREGNLTQSGNSGETSNPTEKQDSNDYENYENGIDNTDFMKNVRFKLQDTRLVYVYNSAPEIKIDDKVNLEFDRNQKINEEELKKKLMEGITVSDDHDKGEELKEKVIVGNLDLTTIGEKEVEYRVVDSWGRSSLVKRKVTVYPLNSLEYNYITLRNNETFDPILTIKLNDETKKFVVDKIDRSKIPSSLSNDTKLFELKLIRKKKENSNTKASEENSVGKDEEVVKTITLTKADLMNGEKINEINEINELSYKYSDYISLWVYDSEDGIFISGKSDVILNGFEASRGQEAMKNTRFEIQKTGLKSIYNEAPKINGLDKKLYVYKNDDITQAVATRELEVKDDSGEISIDSIEVTDVDGKIVKPENSESNSKSKFKFKLKSENSNEDDYIKTDKIREFKLNYKVTDAWGRSATYQRTVSVISRSVSNDIEFYNKEGNENLFSLKYNPITNIFDVSKKGNNSINNGTENNPPSEEQPPQDQSPDESEQSSQGTDGELKAKTGNLSEGNNDTVQDNIPNEGNPDQDDNPSVENPPQDSNNSQDGEGSEGSNDREDNTEQPKKEIVFKLSIFNVEEKKVGEIELTEEETKNIEELKRKLQDITIYDNYYFSIWSNNVSRIKIKGEVHENNKLGEAGNEEQDYYQTITNKDYIDNVRFNLTEDGIHAVYNKAPKITITSKEMLTAYAGDIIDYTKNIEVKDDRDNEENGYIIDNSKIKVTIIPKEANGEDQPIEGEGSNSNEGSSDDGVDTYTQEESSTETEEEAFRKEEEKHLKIGKNTIRLTVEDSWGRATSIERNLLILNGIDKNEIIFKAGSGREPIRIKFNHQDKKLDITTQREKFGDDSNPGYVKIAIYRPNENGVIEPIVSEISINASDRVTDETLQTLKNYEFKYGDYFEIYHGHPQLFSITGGVNDQREDYTDGVQNPENLLNVKFEITKSGLKSIYTNPDENNISDNKVVFGPVAQEKFPFKIKIDFIGKKFKVIDATGTFLKFGDKKIVYKIALIRKERDGTTRIVRETDFRGTDFGKSHMSTENENPNFGNENKNWNGQGFEYNDCLYLWHDESNRSIIKGNIKDVREDYSNGVDDIDNMNNVVFRLTPNGLESIYNEAPKIEGVGDIDVYQNQPFNPADKVTYSDDHDDGHLTISISPNTINTSELGEKTISYTATDRWGKTTTVKRKVTVRPNLYKNVFKVYPQISSEQPDTKPGGNGDNNSSIEGTNPGATTSPNSNLRTGNIGDSNLNSGSESSENTGSNSSSSGSNSSTQNKPWQYEENENRKPAFEIGFDTITKKYKVYNQTSEKLSKDKLDETAFAIQIKSVDGTEKKKIILTGNDRGTSPKLSELNDVQYADDDIIRVYRSDLKGIEITGTVTGNIPSIEDMSTEANRFDYMKNTGFKVSNAGLQAIYNKAPVITGVKKVRTISKGTVDLLQGVTVRDEIDTDISVNSMYIYVNDELIGTTNQNRNSSENSHRYYDFNKVGTYKVKYLLYDKWERTTMIETTVKVESKTRENEIKVYGPDDLNSTSNPKFRIVFDTKNNKILLKGPSEESIVDKENSDDDIESANQENNNINNNQNSEHQDSSLARTSIENYFEIVVRNSKGKEKVNISLNGNTEHDKEQLKNLHELQFDKYDTISLKAQNPNAVKITGNIISENSNGNSKVANSYENGFGTTDKYSQVRFKITDDGLKEITQKNLVINGATNTTIKRGDTLDLLEGVSVNVNDENNDDYELTVEEITANSKAVTIEADENDTDDSSQSGVTTEDKNKFTKLKEGTYTVKYTATNSWGATTTVDRVITVKPRTELEAVKLTVKDYLGEDILIIGFDSITRKLRVIDYKNKSIDYLDNSQVFEINAFDSLGKTLGTIALRGDQEIDQTIIDRINAFPYEEGYSLSVWSKVIDNKIDITGSITTEKEDSKEESKKSRYKRALTSDEKRDKLENGRFEILSDGLKYIYNNAPEIKGNTDEAIPYYKGNLLKAPDTLKITDDHDGTISTTEVTVNDDNVDYDKLGIQNITYVVEDSWGRRATKPGKIEIRSAMDSNSINIYPKENSTTSGSTSEGIQQPNPNPGDTTQGESSQTRTTEIGDSNVNIENGNISEGNNPGNNEGQLQPPQEGENTSTPSVGGNDSDNENNKDNVIVTESSFSIKFVRDNKTNKNRIKVDLGSKSKERFDSSNDGTFLKVKIYDVNGSELKSVDILGTDTGVTAKEKIENELNKVKSDSASKDETENEETEQPQTKTTSGGGDSTENSTNSSNGNSQGGSNSSDKNDQQFEYFNGQYIAIEGVTEATMRFVKIQGTVVNKDKNVSYDNGVSDIDKIQHVRFKFTDLGLEAVYNNAPVVKIDENIMLNGDTKVDDQDNIDGIKGDDFNYLRGVKISDDHDTLTKGNVKVTWNPTDVENQEEQQNKSYTNEDTSTKSDEIIVEGEQKVGENILLYTVTDSWGRSTTAKRNVTLKNGIFENEIKFDKRDLITLKFKENNDKTKVKLIFNVNTSVTGPITTATPGKYHEIKITEPNGRVTTVTINGQDTATQAKEKLDCINNKEYDYGTKFDIYAGHPQNFAINGPVRDSLEDYSDCIQNPENIVNTRFEITDSGLKAIYIEPDNDKLEENQNLISVVAPEKLPIKFKITPNENNTGGIIKAIDQTATQFEYDLREKTFSIELKGSNGQSKKRIEVQGNIQGNDNVFSELKNSGWVYSYGDTLTIWHRTPKKVLIKGKVGNAREDYSDGVDNSLNLEEAVFNLTANGLEAVYRSAPQIMGTIDMEVPKGGTVDYQTLKNSVSAKDNIDGPIHTIQYSAENIDTSKVGMYEFTYTVTNSNQRTTKKSSTITVYDLPTIETNENATIELNSVENDKESIEKYLKTAVVASDDDDKLYGKETKVEVKDNNVNPNVAGTYHATYVATDLYGKTTEKEVDIQVVRTINVTVPTKLPFQVVTNLMPSGDSTVDETTNGFVSGVLKLKNNNTSPVKVSVASFAKKASSGELEIVDPKSCNWDNMNEEESMKKMALGLYIKDKSLTQSNYNESSNPLWLSTNKQNSDDTDNPDSPSDSQEPSSRTGTTEDTNANEVNVINKELGVLPAKETGS